MKRLLLLCMSWLPMAGMASDFCNEESDTKTFLTQWKDSGESVEDIHSGFYDGEFSLERGKVVYQGDLNGDGRDDFIFLSYSSHGSAGDMTYAFLIQCRGYLKHTGGDYFAGIKVLDGPPKNGGDFKDIEIYSYIRDKRGQIRYKNNVAMTRPHLWQFNPQTQRYEGQSE
ncbi:MULTISPECIES: hypothetical protein [unclassified Pseudomonas]|uniref:hypothetical protein n=1 Tax=unclassified Pseudomonas TaxID=196821 RepID=UPI00200BF9CD|nr:MULTISPECIES: hypothetical protein [unclassified Pseudomonas]